MGFPYGDVIKSVDSFVWKKFLHEKVEDFEQKFGFKKIRDGTSLTCWSLLHP